MTTSWLRRMRPALFVAGAVLVVATLLGARALTAGNASDPKSVNSAGNGNIKVGGPIILGTVDSDPQKVWYGPSPVLQSGTIAEVFVKDGQEIKEVGEKLYSFDASIQKHELERAKCAVEMANAKVAEARELAKQHKSNIELQKQAVAAAERKEGNYKDLVVLAQGNAEDNLKREGVPVADWPKKLNQNDTLYKYRVDWSAAITDHAFQKTKLATLEAIDPEVSVKLAEAGVKQAEAEQAKAKTAVDLCTVTAKTTGTIEQVKISPGTTLGVGTRDPALWLIPGGPRVVRGEVEADFAHRVTQDLIGKEVTIFDHNDPRLTYKGTVRRIGGTFLPKRSAEGFLGNDTSVLEAVIEVAELPAGDKRPPLRVGQRVRVNLGQ
jgi:multidrug resistance efflux pump